MSFVCLRGISGRDAHWSLYEIFKLWHNKTSVERSGKMAGGVWPEVEEDRYAERVKRTL